MYRRLCVCMCVCESPYVRAWKGSNSKALVLLQGFVMSSSHLCSVFSHQRESTCSSALCEPMYMCKQHQPGGILNFRQYLCFSKHMLKKISASLCVVQSKSGLARITVLHDVWQRAWTVIPSLFVACRQQDMDIKMSSSEATHFSEWQTYCHMHKNDKNYHRKWLLKVAVATKTS